MALTRDKRAYVSSRFGVELGSNYAGWIYSYDGGMPTPEIITEKFGDDHIPHRHVSKIKYEDITVSCGPAMSKEFHEWLKEGFSQHYQRRNGALVQSDFNLKEITRLSFFQALITEVTFPGGDAGSHDPAKINIKISPEWTRYETGRGSSLAGQYTFDDQKAKKWNVRNFRVTVDGLDCTRINKFEALTLKLKSTEHNNGEDRGPYREPASIEYPSLVLTMPESHSDGFLNWFNDFCINGQCDTENEKGGSIEYLAEDMTTVNCRINFYGLGIQKFTPSKAEAGGESVRTVKVELYTNTMEFEINMAYD